MLKPVEGYEKLVGVLTAAIWQASKGKGVDRHANMGEPFDKQKICEITRRVGLGFPLGQAIKKAEEAKRLGGNAGIKELLGAINYLAAAVIVMDENEHVAAYKNGKIVEDAGAIAPHESTRKSISDASSALSEFGRISRGESHEFFDSLDAAAKAVTAARRAQRVKELNAMVECGAAK